VWKRTGLVVVLVAVTVGFTVVGFRAFVLTSVHFKVGFRVVEGFFDFNGLTVVGFRALVVAWVCLGLNVVVFRVLVLPSVGFRGLVVAWVCLGLNVVVFRDLVLPSVGFRGLEVASVDLIVLENLLTLVGEMFA